MIHYLVIGHACDEEQESLERWFSEKDGEQPNSYLEKLFIDQVRHDWDYDPDKEIYVDFILKSDSPIKVQYG